MTNYAQKESSRHDAQPVELYKFSSGVEQFFYTSAETQRDYAGDTYLAEAISRSAIEQSQEDTAGGVIVQLPRESAIAALFTAYLPIVPVRLTIYRLHRSAATSVAVIFDGTVASAKFSENTCRLICSAQSDVMLRVIPAAVYQSQCNHVLFSKSQTYDFANNMRAESSGCNVNRDAFRVEVTAVKQTGAELTAAGAGSKQDGWFTGGYIERRNGDKRFIMSHAGGKLQLNYPFRDLASEEVLFAYPGCDKLESTCHTKFNNVINFAGFTRLPSKNPFTTSIQ